jgi:hypothetical protein
MRPKRPQAGELPCSPNFILVKLEILKTKFIIGFIITIRHAARSIGLLCARKGRDPESCRARLTSILAGTNHKLQKNYWIYTY